MSAEIAPVRQAGLRRLIGVELRYQTSRMGTEELALLPCNIVLPRRDPDVVAELSCTLHTSDGDVGFTINLDTQSVRSGA